MRPKSPSLSRLGALLCGLLAGCGSSGPAPGAGPKSSAPGATADGSGTPPAGASAEAEDQQPAATPTANKGEIADLAAMCAAVEKDYIDGTLSDYFEGFKAQTPWGAELRARGDESTTPGRELLAAARSRGLVNAQGSSTAALPPACGRLFEDLDDLE